MMINIIIDEQIVTVAAETMIITAIDQLRNSYIPRFCYHPELSLAANCRMCLVEIKNSPKLLPACCTPVQENMQIFTRSAKVKQAQRDVMELLLINHPLDCPTCDQAGECELQDLSLHYGNGKSRYTEQRRVVAEPNFGPLIASNMTRCIHCTRCVRFSKEISGMPELGTIGNHDAMQISTFVEQNLTSGLSGNMIDLCPVGALTAKPSQFQARAWELTQVASIAAHDCVGSNLYLHVQKNKIIRVVPKDTPQINKIWLSDRDRFSYQAVNSQERLLVPMLKVAGHWQNVSWDTALKQINDNLQTIIKQNSAEQIGALISPSATLEEQFLFQKYLRGLGSNNIDHRLKQLDFSYQTKAPLFPNLGIKISELTEQKHVLLIGSNVTEEQPIISLNLVKLTKNKGKIALINPLNWQYNFSVNLEQIHPNGDLLMPIARLAKALLVKHNTVNNNLEIPHGVYTLLQNIEPTTIDFEFADFLLVNDRKLILLGEIALNHPQASEIIALVNVLVTFTQAKFGVLSIGANAAGAWLTGCVPHRLPGGQILPEDFGKTALTMLEKPLKAYILSGIEPEFDTSLGMQAISTLQQANFVAAFSAFKCQSLLKVANVMLPVALPVEVGGTFINIEGQWQNFSAAILPDNQVKPAWKILRVLGVLAELRGFDYLNLAEVTTEIINLIGIEHQLQAWDYWCPEKLTLLADKVIPNKNWLNNTQPYMVDYMVRRAAALQQIKFVNREIV